MNEKITLPTLVQLLAIASGDTKKQSEDFIKEFFSIISQALTVGEQVKIKDFGVFKTIVVDERESVNVSTGERHLIPAHRKVVFVPSKEIATLVNSPFEMFEAVEIVNDLPLEEEEDILHEMSPVDENDNAVIFQQAEHVVDNEEIPGIVGLSSKVAASEETLAETKEETHEEAQEQIGVEGESAISYEFEDSVETEKKDMSPTEDNLEQGQDEEPVNILEQDSIDKPTDQLVEEDEFEDEAHEKKSRFGVGFLCGFVAAAVICGIVYLAVFYYGIIQLPGIRTGAIAEASIKNVTDVDSTSRDPLVLAAAENTSSLHSMDSIPSPENIDKNVEVAEIEQVAENEGPAVPTEPSDKRVFDTITKTRYLTTMAKQHYGNFHLWPYIYIENQDFLGHPDRIRPGTKVVIPPLSKYGVNPNNPADIEKAKKKGVEIYSRYK